MDPMKPLPCDRCGLVMKEWSQNCVCLRCLEAENARLQEALAHHKAAHELTASDFNQARQEAKEAREKNARLTEKFAVKTARLSTELRIGMEQRDAALAENARLTEELWAAEADNAELMRKNSALADQLAAVKQAVSSPKAWHERVENALALFGQPKV